MYFDKESGKIKLGISEFVAISRRGISPTLPFDEDEPTQGEISASRARAILENYSPERLYFGFEAGEYAFELLAEADAVSENKISIIREISSSRAKPGREEAAQIRGEAFTLGHILSSLRGFDSVILSITYLSTSSGEFTATDEVVSAKKLLDFFNRCVKLIAKYARPEVERVTERLPTIEHLKFPYSEVREGQNDFIRQAYKTLSRGGVLYAAAPTGTGKTVSALFPALRALGAGRFQKIFYLTPKSTTSEALRDCVSLMCEGGAKIRAVILTAKERACTVNTVCRKSKAACPYSKCQNIADATLALYERGLSIVDVRTAREVAATVGVCPYELMLSYAELCDVVCCDFNHVFDPQAYIRRFFNKGGDYALLVDEAHNLVERAREIYSAEISEAELFPEELRSVLGEHNALAKIAETATAVFRDVMLPAVKDELRENHDGELFGFSHLREIPARLYTLFGELEGICEGELWRSFSQKDNEAELRTREIRSYYYKIKKFNDALARFDECYELFTFYEKGAIRVKIFCLDASPEIRKRLNICHGSLMFSATLSPISYYKSVLGGERSDDVLEVHSPFSPEQLSVTVMDKVSTRFSEREDTLSAVCRVIAATVSAKRGHYMIFSPSFAYSDALSKALSEKYPKIKIISQTKNMSQKEKEEFLASFKNEDGRYLVAFCVMGGIYSEGIDLAGDSLIGAVIVGIGIPSLSCEREALTEYYNEKYEMGKQYAYIYPGMNRVFQAAGRVIRREDDRGVIVLIDDRFDDPIYKKSMPELWRGTKFIGDAKRLREILDDFWKSHSDLPQ